MDIDWSILIRPHLRLDAPPVKVNNVLKNPVVFDIYVVVFINKNESRAS